MYKPKDRLWLRRSVGRNTMICTLIGRIMDNDGFSSIYNRCCEYKGNRIQLWWKAMVLQEASNG